MDMMQFLFMLIAAAGGGFFAAAIGGNFSFVLVGFTVLMALGAAAGGDAEMSQMMFTHLAFGPFTGPHIAFAGAVAGTAYAAKKGYHDNGGKDIAQPLARLGKPDVLYIGALFGVLGFLLQTAFSYIPWLGTHTDTIAMTVVASAIIVRLVFGGGSLLNPERYNTEGSKLSAHGPYEWVGFMKEPNQLLALGIFPGIVAGAASVLLAIRFPVIGMNANTFMFGISAITIFFLNIGYNSPVTHHMTNIGGLAALLFYPIFAGAQFTEKGVAGYYAAGGLQVNWTAALMAMLMGAVFGTIAAFLGELFARIFQYRGNTHIDPPAFAIFTGNTITWIAAILVGMGAGLHF